jgi:hypothetical protein
VVVVLVLVRHGIRLSHCKGPGGHPSLEPRAPAASGTVAQLQGLSAIPISRALAWGLQ